MKFFEYPYSHNNGVIGRTFSYLPGKRNRGEAMEVNIRYLQQFPVKPPILETKNVTVFMDWNII